MAEKKRGFVRNTKQREVILSVLRGTDTHPTADWIYQEVRRELPNISLGTIYRNLRILVESGDALELSFSGESSRFDGNPKNHYHFACTKCGNVYDIDLPVVDGLNDAAEKLSGHKVKSHRLEFYGICQECDGSAGGGFQ
ncbi:MAG: transcriptional repressor [Firmicutes bacterium]|jgi:Fur family peroxide stress response transcriptional regulator|nr:transcriptional repressor [Bacillota bacterium]